MALAGHYQNVARRQHGDAVPDRLGPVADFMCAPAAFHCLAADFRRVLAARIVVGDDHIIRESRRDTAHYRPFACIAVAAAAE